jgi:hypothetical protein
MVGEGERGLSGDDPKNLVELIFFVMRGAGKSSEVLEAELPEELRVDIEDRLLVDYWASTIERTGMLLAHFSILPRTKAELLEEMQGLFNRTPAWQRASAGEEPMTYELFVRGLRQTVAVQRRAFERVIAEQALDPEAIEAVLAEAPVPTDDPVEPDEKPITPVSDASLAHIKALVEIALDIEAQARPQSPN